MSEHHGDIAEIINKINYWSGSDPAVESALNDAATHWQSSLQHHEEGNYEQAHRDLQVATEHVGTAASLGAYTSDPNYGYSMHPKSLVAQHVQAYKHSYLS